MGNGNQKWTWKQAAKKYGLKISEVKKLHCMSCDKKIGKSKFVLDLMLARFGQVFVRHKRCEVKLR